MRKFIVVIHYFLFWITGFGQTHYQEIQINPFIRIDWYPKFTNSPNPVSTNQIKLRGTSPGLGVALLNSKRKLYFRYGLSFMRQSFNDIEQNNSVFGKSSNRVIEDYTPPGGLTPGVVYTTDRYFYNNLGLEFGLGSFVYFKNSFRFSYGLNLSNYFSFSRTYHITSPQPKGTNFRVSSFQYFSLIADANFSISKALGKNRVGIFCVLPLYQMWKQDSHFPGEDNSNWRNKGLGGISFGLALSHRLK